MPVVITAGPPIESPHNDVGRTSTLLVDPQRQSRMLAIDCWYPALAGDHPPSLYELLPGIGFTASAVADPPAAPGAHPLVCWSHGRSGTRSMYSVLCEGLAARGYIVVSADHPGDTLFDWLTGTAVDDDTNSSQRVGDMRCLLDAVLGDQGELALAPEIDADRVAVAGHSYGAHTAFAVAGSEQTDPRIRAVAGLQSFTRTLPRSVLGRVEVPSLLVVGARDMTTPPSSDADRAFTALGGPDVRRVDIERAGHQACSDVGLYVELSPQVHGLPDMVRDYLDTLAEQVTGRAGDPWRPTVGLHLGVLGAWLDEVLDREGDHTRRGLDDVCQVPGVTNRRA